MSWDTVIGLEVHAQLDTHTKLFSATSTRFGAPPNSQTSLIDAGFPGTLPVLNQQAVHLALRFGLAIHARINQLSYFERKNYVYPDLPKGYQISQFQRPIVGEGYLDVPMDDGTICHVDIVRAHLEEDAGKSLHNKPQQTVIDLNRAGIPLLEIVTAPCLTSAAQTVAYLKALNQLLRFLNICNGSMQEGSFRCDVNISLKRKGTTELGTRVELKNLNSYRFIEKAIAHEQHRQAALLDANLSVQQETRLYHENTDSTAAMRDKEHLCDYRYFPDPDLLPIMIPDTLLSQIKQEMPELPHAINARLNDDGITSAEDLDYLLSSPAVIRFYDKTKGATQAPVKLLVNWLKGPLTAALKEQQQSFEQTSLTPERFGSLLTLLASQQITPKVAKEILNQCFTSKDDIPTLIAASGHGNQDNVDVQGIIKDILAQYPEQIAAYLAGDQKILSFLIGQTLKACQGLADPKEIKAQLLQSIDNI